MESTTRGLAPIIGIPHAVRLARGHVVDGPVRVDLHEAGLGDGDVLDDAFILSATWLIVPGYVFLAFGGAMYAGRMARASKGAWRVTGYVATVPFLLGSAAGWGTELLGVVPGALTFLALVLGWLWMAAFIGRHALGRATTGLGPVPA